MGYAFRRMLSDPQGVGIVDRFDDLFGLFNRPGRFTGDMQQITVPALLCQLTGLCGQLNDCVDGIDGLSESAVCIGKCVSAGTLHLKR
ncbi:MAG: hypothetical protein AB2689_27410 [Candidatus Thiodiazotropha taylori]